MSSLSDLYIKRDVLKTLLDTVDKKGEKGLSITVSISDETNQYGQNTSAFVSQSKEHREAKINKYYVGNGKVFWTDGRIVTAEKKQKQPEPDQPEPDTGDDLPF